MAQVGDVINRKADTMTVFTGPGPAGANQNWVMTTLSNYVIDETTSVVTPSSTGTNSYNSNSNIAMTNTGDAWIYLNLTSSQLVAKGAYGNILLTGNNLNAPLNPDLLLHNFPRNYGSNFSDAYGTDVTVSGSQVNQPVHQIRFKQVGTVYDTTDGWGTLTTPVGTYNCLRVKRISFTRDSTWIKLTPISTWSLFATKIDTSYSYQWLAKETKLALAELNYDSTDTPKTFKWSLIPPITVSLDEAALSIKADVFPVPASDFISVRLSNAMSNGEYFFCIYDMAGKQLMEEKISGTASGTYNIAIQHLPPGFYGWRLFAPDKETNIVGKLTVSR